VDLKHEAMRDRHWKRLMKQTGIEFDMNPDTFTLQSIFEMELSRFVDDIAEILNTAIKEAAIENGIKLVWVTRGQSNTAKAASNFSPLAVRDWDPPPSFGPRQCSPQTAFCSVQPFLHSEAELSRVTDGRTDRLTSRTSVTVVCCSCIRYSVKMDVR